MKLTDAIFKRKKIVKLYYVPGACSLAVDIALRKAGIMPELVRYDPATGKTESGVPLKDINAKNYVPTLIDEDGDVLTEVVSTLIELDIRYPAAKLLPAKGRARREAIEWLAYTSSELQRNFIVPLFMDVPQTGDIKAARSKVESRLEYLADNLPGDAPFFGGETPNAVDFYLVVMMFWTGPSKINLQQWPNMVDYRDRLLVETPIAAAMKAEGLI